MMKITVLFVVALIGLTSYAENLAQEQPKIFFVSPNGNGSGATIEDSADYTDQTFWKNINKRLSRLPVEVVFVSGKYSSGTLTLKSIGSDANRLHLRAADPNSVIFNSKAGTLVEFLGCKNILFEGFNFRGDVSSYAMRVTVDGNFRKGTPSYNITVDNCTWQDLREVYYGAFGVHYGSHNVVLKNSKFIRIGKDGHAHMVYNAYGSSHITVENCYFEDCSGDYVRFRDRNDFCAVINCVFKTTGKYTNAHRTQYIMMPLFNDVDPGDEEFATNYLFKGNKFNFHQSSSTKVAIGFHNSGFNPKGWNYLLTAEEGAILEGNNPQAKAKLLMRNCGIDASKIKIQDNDWGNAKIIIAYSCKAAHGAKSAGWDSIADISDVFGY